MFRCLPDKKQIRLFFVVFPAAALYSLAHREHSAQQRRIASIDSVPVHPDSGACIRRCGIAVHGSPPDAVDQKVFVSGQLRIDCSAGCAFLDGEELHLTPIEYKLLSLLARNCEKVLTHKYITQQVWRTSWENNVASLRVFMATLRKKLEQNSDSPVFIQTHVGIGYRMLRI